MGLAGVAKRLLESCKQVVGASRFHAMKEIVKKAACVPISVTLANGSKVLLIPASYYCCRGMNSCVMKLLE